MSTIDRNFDVVEVTVWPIFIKKRNTLIILEGWWVAVKLIFRENGRVCVNSLIKNAKCGISAEVDEILAGHFDLGEAWLRSAGRLSIGDDRRVIIQVFEWWRPKTFP